MPVRASNQAVYMRTRHHWRVDWRKLWYWFLVIISAALIALALMQIQKPGTLPIRKIHALGAFQHINEEMLRNVVGQTLKGGYFTVNVTEVQHAVTALPWVADASVRRVWPDTLAINVTEQKAIAMWAKGGLVNQHGVLFEPEVITFPKNLPLLDGPAGMERNLTEHYRLAQQIIEPLDLQIHQLRMDSRHAIRLYLSNGIEVILGRESTQSRLQRFARVYTRVLATRAAEIERVDMRYSNGLAVGWRKKNSG